MSQFVAKIRENAMCMQGSTNASTKGHRNVEQASQVFVDFICRLNDRSSVGQSVNRSCPSESFKILELWQI